MGRPSIYTDAILQEICDRLSSGEPLAQICREEGMPGVTTLHTWGKERPDVAERIARAREDGEDVIAADVLKIIDAEPRMVATMHGEAVDSGDVANRKLRAEYRLKLLAKWNPKRWADRLDLKADVTQTINVTDDIPPK